MKSISMRLSAAPMKPHREPSSLIACVKDGTLRSASGTNCLIFSMSASVKKMMRSTNALLPNTGRVGKKLGVAIVNRKKSHKKK